MTCLVKTVEITTTIKFVLRDEPALMLFAISLPQRSCLRSSGVGQAHVLPAHTLD